jgi:hypothetical protein
MGMTSLPPGRFLVRTMTGVVRLTPLIRRIDVSVHGPVLTCGVAAPFESLNKNFPRGAPHPSQSSHSSPSPSPGRHDAPLQQTPLTSLKPRVSSHSIDAGAELRRGCGGQMRRYINPQHVLVASMTLSRTRPARTPAPRRKRSLACSGDGLPVPQGSRSKGGLQWPQDGSRRAVTIIRFGCTPLKGKVAIHVTKIASLMQTYTHL